MGAFARVRTRIDAALGDGRGMTAAEASSRLGNVERAVWALEQLFANLADHAFHLWDQSFTEPAWPGPRVVAAIAEQRRDLDPDLADRLRWTVRWPTERGVALSSVVPELWVGHGAAAQRFLEGVAATWPEDLDPLSLPAPPRWSRAPGPGPTRLSLAGLGSRHALLGAALEALWRAGAEDEALEALFRALDGPVDDEPAVLRRFLVLEGDEDALRAALHPPDPLAAALGVAAVPAYGVVRVADLGAVSAALGGRRAVWAAGPELAREVRAALRQDPDVLLVDAEGADREGAELVVTAALTGHLVLVAGTSPALELALAATEVS